MDYPKLVERIKNLAFIADEQKADAAIKAILGTYASRMHEKHAKIFTANLPDPLTFNKLRGHQAHDTNISLAQFTDQIERQFHLSTEQMQTLLLTVLHAVKETIPEDKRREIEEGLPKEWASVIEHA